MGRLIRILDHVDRCYNGDDGQIIRDVVLPELRNNSPVTLSFSGVDSIPSSFVNTALVSLLDEFEFSEIKRLLKFVGTNSQINEMIKSRFVFEANRKNNKDLKKNSSENRSAFV